MPKGTATCNNIVGLMYNATAWPDVAENDSSSPAAVVQCPLATASYSAASTLASNEATYTNYVRQTVARTTGGWTVPSGGVTQNVAPIEYPQCGVTGNTIEAMATGKGAGAGEVWHYGDLNAPIIVSDQIQPRFPAGNVTITES